MSAKFYRFLSVFALAAVAASAQTPGIAHLRKQGTATQMIVDGTVLASEAVPAARLP
jgi:hypothetical protein